MRKLFLILVIIFFSCDSSDDGITNPVDHNPPDEPQSEISVNGRILLVNRIEMNGGPHQLLINGSTLYAALNHELYVFSISSAENPLLQKVYSHETNKRFGKMFFKNNKLYAANKDENLIYVFDSALNLQSKYTINSSSFSPNSIYIDQDGIFWLGGSNGSNGMLLKCSLSGDALTVQQNWTASYNESNIESLSEKDNYILVSNAKGNFLTFSKNDISSPSSDVTFVNEPGHEKWGKSFVLLNNQVFWANWGAGLANLDLTNPASPTVSTVITHSKFKTQFPDSEGTMVYDVAYNSTKNLICVANGWSGVFLVGPDNPDVILDYIDPKDVQNASVATSGKYIFTGNISGGISGNLKGIMIYMVN